MSSFTWEGKGFILVDRLNKDVSRWFGVWVGGAVDSP